MGVSKRFCTLQKKASVLSSLSGAEVAWLFLMPDGSIIKWPPHDHKVRSTFNRYRNLHLNLHSNSNSNKRKRIVHHIPNSSMEKTKKKKRRVVDPSSSSSSSSSSTPLQTLDHEFRAESELGPQFDDAPLQGLETSELVLDNQLGRRMIHHIPNNPNSSMKKKKKRRVVDPSSSSSSSSSSIPLQTLDHEFRAESELGPQFDDAHLQGLETSELGLDNQIGSQEWFTLEELDSWLLDSPHHQELETSELGSQEGFTLEELDLWLLDSPHHQELEKTDPHIEMSGQHDGVVEELSDARLQELEKSESGHSVVVDSQVVESEEELSVEELEPWWLPSDDSTHHQELEDQSELGHSVVVDNQVVESEEELSVEMCHPNNPQIEMCHPNNNDQYDEVELVDQVPVFDFGEPADYGAWGLTNQEIQSWLHSDSLYLQELHSWVKETNLE